MTAKLKAICLSFIFILVALFPLGITQNAIAADGYEIEGTVVCTGSTAEYRIPVAGFEIGEVIAVEVYVQPLKSGVSGYTGIKIRTLGQWVDDCLPVSAWSRLYFEGRVCFDAEKSESFVKTEIENCEGYTINFTKANATTNPLKGDMFGGATVYMLPSTTTVQNQSYVIKTASGKIIVFDGGNYTDGEYLSKFLLNMTSEVDAWFFSHYHDDHIGAFAYIIEHDLVDVNTVYYDFPTKEETIKFGDGAFPEYTVFMNNVHKCKKIVTPKENDVFVIDDVTFTALNSLQYISGNFGNNTTITYKIDTLGVSMLFLGDCGIELGDYIMNNHAEEIKQCEVIQMAHHGQKGVSHDFYKALNGRIYLINAPTALYYANYRGEINDNTSVDTFLTRGWVRDLNVLRKIPVLWKLVVMK